MTIPSMVRQNCPSGNRHGASRVNPLRAERPVEVKKPLGPRLWRVVQRGLVYISWPLFLVALGAGSYEGALLLLPYMDRPIARVGVDGLISDADRASLQQLMTPYVQTRFFSANLEAIQKVLEAQPLVASARVKRIWPDKIEVGLQMEIPIARWGDGDVLNSSGEVLKPANLTPFALLPLLRGPQWDTEKVLDQYHALNQLLRQHGMTIAALTLNDRGSWYLTTAANDLGPGFQVYLGSEPLTKKTERFLTLYEKALKSQVANIKRIDLRYANGLAVAWRQPGTAAAPATAAGH